MPTPIAAATSDRMSSPIIAMSPAGKPEVVDRRLENRRLRLAENECLDRGGVLQGSDKRAGVELQTCGCLPVSRSPEPDQLRVAAVQNPKGAVKHLERPAFGQVADHDAIGLGFLLVDAGEVFDRAVLHQQEGACLLSAQVFAGGVRGREDLLGLDRKTGAPKIFGQQPPTLRGVVGQQAKWNPRGGDAR